MTSDTDVLKILPKDINVVSAVEENSHWHEDLDPTSAWSWVLIVFLQDRGQGWKPFTIDEIAENYGSEDKASARAEAEAFVSNLKDSLIKIDEETYQATSEFVVKWYQRSPAAPEIAA